MCRLRFVRPLLSGLSRSAGSGSSKGQDGLNYWLCCCHSLQRQVQPSPQPSLSFHPLRAVQGGSGGSWGPEKAEWGGFPCWTLGYKDALKDACTGPPAGSQPGSHKPCSCKGFPQARGLAFPSSPLEVQSKHPGEQQGLGSHLHNWPLPLSSQPAWGRRAELRQCISHMVHLWGGGRRMMLPQAWKVPCQVE